LHMCTEGRLCDWWSDSRSFRYPTHHITVENRRRIAAKSLVFEGRNERRCGQCEENTRNNNQPYHSRGDSLRRRFDILTILPFFQHMSTAYLFWGKWCSHNKYPHFEARSCQTRIGGTTRTPLIHRIVSSGRRKGCAAAFWIPMVSHTFY